MTGLRLRLLPLACVLLGAPPAALALSAEPGSIWFPRPAAAAVATRSASASRTAVAAAAADSTRTWDPPAPAPLQTIPLEILLKLSDVENVTYFLNNFVDTDTLAAHESINGMTELENRFGPVDERKSTLSAKPAVCKPQLELVPLMIPTDPSMYYYPTCTRIERCGGCCGSNLLSCQAVETEIVNLKVIVTQYTGDKPMAFRGYEIIPLERHTKCKCDCIKKESDCNQFQEYRKNECECACINVDEQQKCLAESYIKEWDVSACICKCKETRECTTGNYFDQDICRCTQMPSLRNRRREINSSEPML